MLNDFGLAISTFALLHWTMCRSIRSESTCLPFFIFVPKLVKTQSLYPIRNCDDMPYPSKIPFQEVHWFH